MPIVNDNGTPLLNSNGQPALNCACCPPSVCDLCSTAEEQMQLTLSFDVNSFPVINMPDHNKDYQIVAENFPASVVMEPMLPVPPEPEYEQEYDEWGEPIGEPTPIPYTPPDPPLICRWGAVVKANGPTIECITNCGTTVDTYQLIQGKHDRMDIMGCFWAFELTIERELKGDDAPEGYTYTGKPRLKVWTTSGQFNGGNGLQSVWLVVDQDIDSEIYPGWNPPVLSPEQADEGYQQIYNGIYNVTHGYQTGNFPNYVYVNRFENWIDGHVIGLFANCVSTEEIDQGEKPDTELDVQPAGDRYMAGRLMSSQGLNAIVYSSSIPTSIWMPLADPGHYSCNEACYRVNQTAGILACQLAGIDLTTAAYVGPLSPTPSNETACNMYVRLTYGSPPDDVWVRRDELDDIPGSGPYLCYDGWWSWSLGASYHASWVSENNAATVSGSSFTRVNQPEDCP